MLASLANFLLAAYPHRCVFLVGVLPALRGEPFWICFSGTVGGMIAAIGIGWHRCSRRLALG